MKNNELPTPDQDQIETYLSQIQPTPGEGFHHKLAQAPWVAVQTGKGKPNMKFKYVFAVLTLVLVFAATVAFVPPVRAQVSEFFSIAFKDGHISIASQGKLPINYQLMQLNYLPATLKDAAQSIGLGETSILHYQHDDQFLLVTQSKADGTPLPEGEAVTVNGVPAILNSGLSGTYESFPQVDLTPVAGDEHGNVTFSSGGGGADATPPPEGEIQGISGTMVPAQGLTVTRGTNLQPLAVKTESIAYTDAAKLTLVLGDTKVELLTNLPVDELMKIAEGLAPAQ